MPKKVGKVYLVGAGPGDPELITLKGLKCLKEADVVVYDRLVNPRLLEKIPEGVEIIYAGKSPDRHTLSQDKINALLVKLAKQAKIVARLKGGDPFLFGRGAEEAIFLARHKVPFEVVPGITSAIAVPSYAGIPLTHRRYASSVGIFTGQEEPAKEYTRINWKKISSGLDTLVFLMGVENLPRVVDNLIKFGRPKNTPCCLIQQGTLPEQKSITATLQAIAKKAKAAKIQPPAILVAGEVVSLRKKINWYEAKPLFGKKILVTSPVESSLELAKALEGHGASCTELPLIKLEPLDDYSKLDSSIKNIEDFHWIIFTSQNGAKFFKKRLDYLKKDVRILKDVNIAAIGPRTKMALENMGLRVDIEPQKFCQEGLIKCFRQRKIMGKNILLVRALEARGLLPKELKKIGAKVKIVPAYKVVASRQLPATRQALKDIDLITFTSSSCVRNFFMVQKSIKHFPILLRKSPKVIAEGDFLETFSKGKHRTASIGPVTSQEARRLGLKVDIEAKRYTVEGLVEAIVKYYR